MSNKENVSINREELTHLKQKLQEAYQTGYRQGMENGFMHALDIMSKTIVDLKTHDIIKQWCDEVIKTSEILTQEGKSNHIIDAKN